MYVRILIDLTYKITPVYDIPFTWITMQNILATDYLLQASGELCSLPVHLPVPLLQSERYGCSRERAPVMIRSCSVQFLASQLQYHLWSCSCIVNGGSKGVKEEEIEGGIE